MFLVVAVVAAVVVGRRRCCCLRRCEGIQDMSKEDVPRSPAPEEDQVRAVVVLAVLGAWVTTRSGGSMHMRPPFVVAVFRQAGKMRRLHRAPEVPKEGQGRIREGEAPGHAPRTCERVRTMVHDWHVTNDLAGTPGSGRRTWNVHTRPPPTRTSMQ